MSKFCAICIGAIQRGTGSLEPLGRNDALVLVCARCSSEPGGGTGVSNGYGIRSLYERGALRPPTKRWYR